MLSITWPKLLTGEDLPDVGYTFWLRYLWRWIIKGVAGYSLYFPVLQTQRHNADQGNFSSPKFKGRFLLMVRKSQPLLVLIQFKIPTTFAWVHLGSLWWLSVRLWMLRQKGAALPRWDFSLPAVLTSNSSTLATACARGNPKFWKRLLEMVPSPPAFQTEEQQRVYGVQAGFKQEECGWQGGRKAGEG